MSTIYMGLYMGLYYIKFINTEVTFQYIFAGNRMVTFIFIEIDTLLTKPVSSAVVRLLLDLGALGSNPGRVTFWFYFKCCIFSIYLRL